MEKNMYGYEYDSPIKQIVGQMNMEYENGVMKAVQSVGFDVNKEELSKALMYDRNQYDKGYRRGRAEKEKEIIDIISDLKTYSVNGYDFPIPTDYIIRQIKEQHERNIEMGD